MDWSTPNRLSSYTWRLIWGSTAGRRSTRPSPGSRPCRDVLAEVHRDGRFAAELEIRPVRAEERVPADLEILPGAPTHAVGPVPWASKSCPCSAMRSERGWTRPGMRCAIHCWRRWRDSGKGTYCLRSRENCRRWRRRNRRIAVGCDGGNSAPRGCSEDARRERELRERRIAAPYVRLARQGDGGRGPVEHLVVIDDRARGVVTNEDAACRMARLRRSSGWVRADAIP